MVGRIVKDPTNCHGMAVVHRPVRVVDLRASHVMERRKGAYIAGTTPIVVSADLPITRYYRISAEDRAGSSQFLHTARRSVCG